MFENALPFVSKLKEIDSVLIAGIGGGYDIFGGLSLALEMYQGLKHVTLVSFNTSDCKEFLKYPDDLGKSSVFPENQLAAWLTEQGIPVSLYVFPKVGVIPLTAMYKKVIEAEHVQAIFAVDGGVDSLMRGDEEGAGTILEDTISLTALSKVEVASNLKILACLGFGTEKEERLCHHHVLRNMASLAASGDFVGSFSLTAQNKYYQSYKAACESAWDAGRRKSHIHTRVISAIEGEFGDKCLYGDIDARVAYASEAEDYISPLMGIYWFFNLEAVVKRNLLAEAMAKTSTSTDVLMIFRQMIDILAMNKKQRSTIPY